MMIWAQAAIKLPLNANTSFWSWQIPSTRSLGRISQEGWSEGNAWLQCVEYVCCCCTFLVFLKPAINPTLHLRLHITMPHLNVTLLNVRWHCSRNLHALRLISQLTNDTWHMTNHTWHMTHDTWQMTHGKWQMTNDKWQMTNDKCQMTNDKWQMSNDKWQTMLNFY